MTDRFPICHPITAAYEGGWSNHPQDPGGATMYGVIQTVYDAWRKKKGLPRRSVKFIEMSEALEIYRTNYWVPCGAPNLFPGVDLAVYDASVNSGVSRGRKWLAASLGSTDHTETVKRICRARLSFMQSLKIWKTFGKGWGRRVAGIEAKGVAMAMEAMGTTAGAIRTRAKIEASQATADAKSADKTTKTLGTAGAASGGAPVAADQVVTPVDTTTLAMLGVVALVCIVAAIIFFAKKRAAEARAEAYQEISA